MPIIALTATASRQAIKDIINGVKIQNCKRITMSFNRPNLSYEVRPRRSKVDTLKEIVEFINTKHKGQTGIIYVNSRSGAEDLARELRTDYRIGAHHYHAFLSDRDKEDVQKSWQSGRFPIIVATVRYCVCSCTILPLTVLSDCLWYGHRQGRWYVNSPEYSSFCSLAFVLQSDLSYTTPFPRRSAGKAHSCSQSWPLLMLVFRYYQETGRAGRDGKPSDCILCKFAVTYI